MLVIVLILVRLIPHGDESLILELGKSVYLHFNFIKHPHALQVFGVIAGEWRRIKYLLLLALLFLSFNFFVLRA